MMQFGVLLIWTLALTPAVAHHSVSGQWLATDDKLFTVTGILKSVEWTNPHVHFNVITRDAGGNEMTYSFENFPPSFFRRYGVNKTEFKVGETITIEAYPARDGNKSIGFAKIIHFSDGKTLATMTAESASTVR